MCVRARARIVAVAEVVLCCRVLRFGCGKGFAGRSLPHSAYKCLLRSVSLTLFSTHRTVIRYRDTCSSEQAVAARLRATPHWRLQLVGMVCSRR